MYDVLVEIGDQEIWTGNIRTGNDDDQFGSHSVFLSVLPRRFHPKRVLTFSARTKKDLLNFFNFIVRQVEDIKETE